MGILVIMAFVPWASAITTTFKTNESGVNGEEGTLTWNTNSATFYAARNAAGELADITSNALYVGIRGGTAENNINQFRRVGLQFNTSSLPDDAIISDAKLAW